MADNKCQYQLKGKYNGVYGNTNDSLTDKKAESLAKKHPRGNDLFAVLPSKLQKERDDKIALDAKALEDYRKVKRSEVQAEKDKQEAKLLSDAPKKITVVQMQNKVEAKLSAKKTPKNKD